jgi:hypothetical protein
MFTTCNADRLNADAADQALFANLAACYRTEHHLIAGPQGLIGERPGHLQMPRPGSCPVR